MAKRMVFRALPGTHWEMVQDVSFLLLALE